MIEQTLAEQIQGVLRECPFVKGYNLSVCESPENVVVKGVVNSYFAKQMAQETAIRFLKEHYHQGVTANLVNEIIVNSR